jgi:hypothetical protein
MTTPTEPISALPKRKLIVVPPIEKHPDNLLTGREVAAMLGVDPSWVKNHCTRVEPMLPFIQLGLGRTAKRRFKREHILQFIEENTRMPRKRI